ncbi:hypothetical protein [Deinococcus aquaedulcis]|uniref:hypothetical protein n=1 Tax=Deinococcus aquaedulcis TaxID=2840455 RepID=UPI001C83750A|nr:hypothetical protein [Deinococcus aquaedulcis]
MNRESFDQDVQGLVGLQLKRVRYYELHGDWPSWHADPDFDSLKQGLDFIGDDASFFITWDASFWSYGLCVRSGALVDFLSGGQFGDVSATSRWSGLCGQRVRAARFIWEPIPLAEDRAVYPQHLVLTFEAGNQVYVSAATPQGTRAPFFGMSDHVVVLFDQELARHYLHGIQ